MLQKLIKQIEREDKRKPNDQGSYVPDKENIEKEINNTLQRIHANCNFFFYSNTSDSDIRTLCKYILKVIDEFYTILEDSERSFEFDNNELDTDTEDEDNDEKKPYYDEENQNA